jgi:hypothetical protein
MRGYNGGAGTTIREAGSPTLQLSDGCDRPLEIAELVCTAVFVLAFSNAPFALDGDLKNAAVRMGGEPISSDMWSSIHTNVRRPLVDWTMGSVVICRADV